VKLLLIDEQHVGVVSARKHDRQPTQTYQTVERGPDPGGQIEFRFEIMKGDGHLIDPVQDVVGQGFEKFNLGALDVDFHQIYLLYTADLHEPLEGDPIHLYRTDPASR